LAGTHGFRIETVFAMTRVRHAWIWLLALTAVAIVGEPVLAQEKPVGTLRTPYRKLAPGVMQSINPDRELNESYSRHDVVELLAVDPGFGWAKDVRFGHDIWVLDFQFKPVRMIWVDIPQADGYMRRTLIWYMVYSVTNPGRVMQPVENADNTYTVKYVDRPIQFVPKFTLVSQDLRPKNKAYLDRVIPVAMGPITMREDPKRRFLNSAQICREIAVGETLWGVATWRDVDPRIDRFSVFVQGLTNAYRWKDQPAQVKPGVPAVGSRQLLQKTLQLNFWRPGDAYYEDERLIRFGIPGEVDYRWVYR